MDSGRVVVVSDTTAATSPEDIDSLSTTVTLQNPGEVMAFMSLSSAVNIANREGYFLIDIDGVDSPIITRKHSTAVDTSSVGVIFTSGTLAAGTYTVKGEQNIK